MRLWKKEVQDYRFRRETQVQEEAQVHAKFAKKTQRAQRKNKLT
jgi:hypothetical protein